MRLLSLASTLTSPFVATARQGLFASCLIAIVTLLPATAHSKVVADINDPELIASVGELQISSPVIKIFWRAYQSPQQKLSVSQVLEKLLDDSLLAQHALSTLDEEQLSSENKVGFKKQVQRQDRLLALVKRSYQKELVAAIKQLPGGSLNGISKNSPQMNAKMLKSELDLKNSLRVEVTTQQAEKIKTIILSKVSLAKDKVLSVSLWDVYRKQNVQGRLALHSGDFDFLVQQLEQHIGNLFILDWAEQKLSAEDFASLKQLIKNQQLAQQYVVSQGLQGDMHKDNPELRKQAKAVSQKAIKQFYQEHKDEFAVVEKVKAQHIRFASQDKADQVLLELNKGSSFDQAVKKYSIDSDKNKTPAGDLGWLKRDDKNKTLLHSIAFTLKKGQLSQVFRTPLKDKKVVYEIVLATDRVDGFLAIDDATVSYQARRHLALENMKENFEQLKKQLRDDATIRINASLLK